MSAAKSALEIMRTASLLFRGLITWTGLLRAMGRSEFEPLGVTLSGLEIALWVPGDLDSSKEYKGTNLHRTEMPPFGRRN